MKPKKLNQSEENINIWSKIKKVLKKKGIKGNDNNNSMEEKRKYIQRRYRFKKNSTLKQTKIIKYY